MLRAHWIIQVYTGDWDSNIHVDDTFMDSIDVTNKDFNIGDFGTNCHFGSHVLLQGPDPNTLRKVERKNICGGQITLTFIHEILIPWGQTFHFSEHLTSLFSTLRFFHQSTPTCHGVRQFLSTIGWLDPQEVGRHRHPTPERVILTSLKEYKHSLTFLRVNSPLRSQAAETPRSASPAPEASPGPTPDPTEPPSADQ